MLAWTPCDTGAVGGVVSFPDCQKKYRIDGGVPAVPNVPEIFWTPAFNGDGVITLTLDTITTGGVSGPVLVRTFGDAVLSTNWMLSPELLNGIVTMVLPALTLAP